MLTLIIVGTHWIVAGTSKSVPCNVSCLLWSLWGSVPHNVRLQGLAGESHWTTPDILDVAWTREKIPCQALAREFEGRPTQSSPSHPSTRDSCDISVFNAPVFSIFPNIGWKGFEIFLYTVFHKGRVITYELSHLQEQPPRVIAADTSASKAVLFFRKRLNYQ